MSESTTVEAIRERPGMYIGTAPRGGVAGMVLEVVSNSFDQVLAGRCSEIAVELEADGAFVVRDNGPGIPGDLHRLVTELSERPTVDGHRPHVHLAHGVGLMPLVALSDRFELSTVRDGLESRGVYARGEVLEPFTTAPSAKIGTIVRIVPDASVVPPVHASRTYLAQVLEELAFLAPGLRVSLRDAGFVTRGLPQLVAAKAGCSTEEVTYAKATIDDTDIEIAVYLHDGHYERTLDSFVNYMRSPEHGTHVDGLLDGVGEAFGLVAAVAIVKQDVKWGTPAKHRVASPELRPLVAEVVRRALASRR